MRRCPTSPGQCVDPPCKVDVAAGEAAGVMGGEEDIDLVPDVRPFWVMIGLLGGERDRGHEGEGLVEVVKGEAAGNAVAGLVPGPVAEIGQCRLARGRIELCNHLSSLVRQNVV